jgi:hypothetical protein
MGSVWGGVVSPGWSLAIWVSLRAMQGNAHLFSGAGSGYSLRVSINSVTRVVELVSAGGGVSATCSGATVIPLYQWTLISVTQLNNSASAWAAAPTQLYVNGVLDRSCTSVPYWGSPSRNKASA